MKGLNPYWHREGRQGSSLAFTILNFGERNAKAKATVIGDKAIGSYSTDDGSNRSTCMSGRLRVVVGFRNRANFCAISAEDCPGNC